MMRINMPMFTFATALAVVLAPPVACFAQGDALYKSKCAMCHGADGTKAAGHDLSSADVQKQSDADLAAVITGGKPPKMPAYKSLSADDVKRLVTYIRTLKK